MRPGTPSATPLARGTHNTSGREDNFTAFGDRKIGACTALAPLPAQAAWLDGIPSVTYPQGLAARLDSSVCAVTSRVICNAGGGPA